MWQCAEQPEPQQQDIDDKDLDEVLAEIEKINEYILGADVSENLPHWTERSKRPKPPKAKVGAVTQHRAVGTDIDDKDLDEVLAEIETLINEN